MRTFQKSHKLDYVCYDLRGPVLDEANRMEAEGIEILKLNIGNPAPFGFRAPKMMIDRLADNLDNYEGYSDSKGILPAREAIFQYARSKNIPVESVEDIYTGNGASELITLSMQALLDHGDEILVPSPDYPLWTASVTLAGGTAVHYLCDEEQEWYPDIEDMRRKITPKTKGIVVINPNNPTGAVYPREILEKIVDLAREFELILFADEIYDRLVFEPYEHIALASLAPDLLTISFNGLSKSHLLCGYRCGWMIVAGNKSIGEDYIAGLKLMSSLRLCSNVPGQSVVASAMECLDSTKALMVPGGRVYEQRETICKVLSDIPGLTFVKPKAAFYLFPKLDRERFNIKDDEQFALDLLKEQHVLVTHGGGFHWEGMDHFRIVYLPEVDVLNACGEGIKEFLRTYRQAD